MVPGINCLICVCMPWWMPTRLVLTHLISVGGLYCFKIFYVFAILIWKRMITAMYAPDYVHVCGSRVQIQTVIIQKPM